jgi:hypothetical protein
MRSRLRLFYFLMQTHNHPRLDDLVSLTCFFCFLLEINASINAAQNQSQRALNSPFTMCNSPIAPYGNMNLRFCATFEIVQDSSVFQPDPRVPEGFVK